MAAAIRELRDPLGWALAVLAVLANLSLGVSPIKAAAVAVVVLAVKMAAGLVWPRPKIVSAPPAPAEVARVKGRPVAGSKLTARELEVAQLIAGHSNKEIGHLLVPKVKEKGVDHHVLNIMIKLNVHTRSEIAAWVATNYRQEK